MPAGTTPEGVTGAIALAAQVPAGTGVAPAAPTPGGGGAAPGPIATQVFDVIMPVQSIDGAHHVVVALSPEGLGTVQAAVTVSGTVVTVHLVADNSAGHQALADSLSQLQHEMSRDGSQVTVSLSQGGGSNGSSNRSPAGSSGQSRQADGEPSETDTEPSAVGAARTSQVDLRL